MKWLCFAFLVQLVCIAKISCNSIRERNLFATELFQTIATENQQQNVIISPVAIQTALGLAYYGAEGKTATELQKGLHATAHQSKEGLAKSYHNLLHSYVKSKTILEIANKIYTREGMAIAPEFRAVAQKYFDSDAEELNFENETYAVREINQWLAEKTNGRIQNILTNIDPSTNVALVNAIFFKAKWARPFMDEETSERDFWLNAKQAIKVPTMFADNWYYYADYPELDAKAIELFFENIDLTMWFILPNKRDGLLELEQKLKGVDFKALEDRWEWKSVAVYLPKFKFEFDTDLKPALQKLGIETMFSGAADFSSIFQHSPINTRISQVQHKAFIDVNEIGCEAAAASVVVGVPMSLPLEPKTFVADHPFAFIIRDKYAMYFAGHIVKF
ncbi:serine protease inhibitor 42Dd-like [Teleopsis dalmanni]|uniref:serine protease inhibitor 42Dd-like n=1 Tax=Teleopsis dalmanni TaxID=139649 RepID=UPI0018CC875B|nr:serine protease inhibitor 42Dd-like [Teleopsis dalmanni]XP_037954400.1 serine protease inhibitor 42Dd-like [Teleopsis dalmanni]